MASSRSKKNSPVVIEGSLKDRIVRVDETGFDAFAAVALAHFKISVSLMGFPPVDLDNVLSVFVMLNLLR